MPRRRKTFCKFFKGGHHKKVMIVITLMITAMTKSEKVMQEKGTKSLGKVMTGENLNLPGNDMGASVHGAATGTRVCARRALSRGHLTTLRRGGRRCVPQPPPSPRLPPKRVRKHQRSIIQKRKDTNRINSGHKPDVPISVSLHAFAQNRTEPNRL